MDEDIKPKPQKIVIIMDGERPCYIGYADSTQEKKIMEILLERRRKLAN